MKVEINKSEQYREGAVVPCSSIKTRKMQARTPVKIYAFIVREKLYFLYVNWNFKRNLLANQPTTCHGT